MNAQTRSIIILIIFLIFVVGGGIFYLIINRISLLPVATVAPAISPTGLVVIKPTTVATQMSTPVIIVNTFYQTYIDCMKTPPPITCTPLNSVNVDQQALQPSLQRNASQGDGITCSTTMPQAAQVASVSPINEGKATAIVIEDFGNGLNKQLSVDIVIQSGTWKIVNITCPS